MWGLLLVLGLVLLVNQHSGNQARIRETKRNQADLCQSINNERHAILSYISGQIDRAEKSIPTLNYYQHHPVELGRALANMARQRKEAQRSFSPLKC